MDALSYHLVEAVRLERELEAKQRRLVAATRKPKSALWRNLWSRPTSQRTQTRVGVPTVAAG